MDKLKSRKFWVTLVVMILVMFSEALGLDLDAGQLTAMVTLAAGYLVGQGVADHGQGKAVAQDT
jgi:uncharacterized membrane protein